MPERGFTNVVRKQLQEYWTGLQYTEGVFTFRADDPDYDDHFSFDEVPASVMLDIIGKLPAEALEEYHNDAPTVGEFMDFAKRFGGMMFTGYLVGPRRGDERVSIDGCYVPHNAGAEDALAFMSRRASISDDFEHFGIQYTYFWWD